MNQKEKDIRLRFKPLIDKYTKTKNKEALGKYEALIQEEIKRPILDRSKIEKSIGGN